ncbi:ATP-binding protein [Halobacteriovorax sp. GFR7]|uniref:ATP-binding protein n=1 Tax=unclassified Halobacteriovorax TaxID=2639665 RepID=UPI003D9621F3
MHFLNLRNKILSCGLLILILVTSFNLYYTYQVFQDDKESYIFENVLRSTEIVDREISRSSLEDVKSIMNSDKVFSYILVKEGRVIYGDESIYQSELIKEVSSQAIVKELRINNQSFLTGIIKNQNSNYVTIAYINKNKAFASLDYLMKKNLYFSLIIFGIVLILTIFFARSITNPILKIIKRTVEISNGDYENEVSVKTNDELKILGDSINTMSHEIKSLLDQKQDMIVKLEEANKKLDIYSKDLERLVDERTKDLKDANAYITAMLNSLSQGLFVIKPDGTCSDLFTNSCLEIFGDKPKDRDFVSYIKDKNPTAVEKWLEITFSEKMPFSSCAPLGPSSFEAGHIGEDDFKHIKLDYYPLMLDESLGGIVVLATDITQELILQADISKKEAYINKVTEFVLNKDVIKNLVSEANTLLDEIIEAPESENFNDRALMVFHTINGGFATYSFIDIQQYAIECEEFIQTKNENKNITQDIKGRAALAKDLINQSIDELENKFSNGNTINISNDDLNYLKNSLSQLGEEGKNILHNFLDKKSISSLFTPYPNLVRKLSKSLNKPMKELIIPESDYRVEPEKIQELSNALVHVFKNSLDHGIEINTKRLENRKEEAGEIKLDIKKHDKEILVTISDDGGGLNLEAIRGKLEKIYDKESVDKLSEHELMSKIFDPNFSTRDNVSQYSGRGIGMSAVKEAVEKLNGTIKVNSKENEGTTFELSLKI